jgi:hypothetical protein
LTDRSVQERFVREISSHLLGDQFVFKPLLYRNAEEPADLVWMTGRCLVILNATSGRRSLQQMSEHNNSQMHRWLRRWQNGELLRGPDNVSLAYSDIDYVIGLSIVGGENAASFIDEDQVRFSRAKGRPSLCACATISDGVLLKLAEKCVGIMDIIDFLQYLRDRGDVVEDKDALDWIEYWEMESLAGPFVQFLHLMPVDVDMKDSWEYTKGLLHGLKNDLNVAHISKPILSDIGLADAYWIAIAERTLALQIAEPGQTGALSVGAIRRKKYYNMMIMVSANISVAAKNIPKIEMEDYAFFISTTLDHGIKYPAQIIATGNVNIEDHITLHSAVREFRDQMPST